MKKLHALAFAFFAVFLASSALYILQPLGGSFFIIGDSSVIVFAFLSVLCGYYAYRLHGFSSMYGKALIFITIGLFMWFMGETTWGIYEIALGIEAPPVSLADVFWLLGYPLLFAGFYVVWRTSSFPESKKTRGFASALLLVLLLIMVWLVAPIWAAQDAGLLEKAVISGYVIGDVLLLMMLSVSLICLSNSRFMKPWSIVFFGLFLSSLADIYYMNFYDVYSTGSLIDILWNLSYLMLAYGFLYKRENVMEIVADVKSRKKTGRKGAS